MGASVPCIIKSYSLTYRYFKQPVSSTSSSVKISDEVPRDDVRTIDTVAWTSELESVFKQNAKDDPQLRLGLEFLHWILCMIMYDHHHDYVQIFFHVSNSGSGSPVYDNDEFFYFYFFSKQYLGITYSTSATRSVVPNLWPAGQKWPARPQNVALDLLKNFENICAKTVKLPILTE